MSAAPADPCTPTSATTRARRRARRGFGLAVSDTAALLAIVGARGNDGAFTLSSRGPYSNVRPVADVQQSFTTPIEAPLAVCYQAIADFDAYSRWSSPITQVRVIDRHPDGHARQVEFFVDMKLKTLRYVLEYRWESPDRLTWTMAEGDLEGIEGSYVFERLDDRRTQATCSQAVSLGFWVPGLLRRRLEQTALKQSVLEFKAEAERRVRA